MLRQQCVRSRLARDDLTFVRKDEGANPLKLGRKVVATRLGRQLSGDNRVDVVGREQTVLCNQNDQDVRMRQATLLELDDVEVRHRASKDAIFVELFQEVVELELEDARDQVRAIFCRLPR